jgi:hypothetical protein
MIEMDTIEMKLPKAIRYPYPRWNASDMEWHNYYSQFSAEFHLSNCPLHMELWGD